MGLSKVSKTQADPLYVISTILLAEADGELRRSIGNLLSENGCHVLEANDQPSTFHIIETHSRHIDVLVIAADMDHSHFSELLQRHRKGMCLTYIPRRTLRRESNAPPNRNKSVGGGW